MQTDLTELCKHWKVWDVFWLSFPSPYLPDSNSQCYVIDVVPNSQLELGEFQNPYFSTKQTSQLRLCEFQNPYFCQKRFTTEMNIYDLLWFLQKYCFTLAILPYRGNSKYIGKSSIFPWYQNLDHLSDFLQVVLEYIQAKLFFFKNWKIFNLKKCDQNCLHLDKWIIKSDEFLQISINQGESSEQKSIDTNLSRRSILIQKSNKWSGIVDQDQKMFWIIFTVTYHKIKIKNAKLYDISPTDKILLTAQILVFLPIKFWWVPKF